MCGDVGRCGEMCGDVWRRVETWGDADGGLGEGDLAPQLYHLAAKVTRSRRP